MGRSEAPFAERVAELWRRCKQAGRPALPVTAFYIGRASDAELEEHQRLDVERVVLPLPPVGRDRVLPRVELYASLVERVA